MIYFLITATLLLYACMLFVLPSIRKSGKADNDQHDVNLKAYDHKISELEKDLTENQINQTEYQHAKIELDRQLIQDERHFLKKTESLAILRQYQLVIIFIVSLPLLAIFFYSIFGHSELLSVKPTILDNSPHANTARQSTPGKGKMPDVAKMLKRVEDRLAKNPDKIEDWKMLARSYAHLKQFDKAAKAMAEIVKRQPSNEKAKTEHKMMLAQAKKPGQVKQRPIPGFGKMPDVNAMIARVKKRVKDNPNNIKDWALLVRTYRQLKKFDKAAKAMAEIVKRQPNNVDALVKYADLLAAANNMKLTGSTMKLLARALEINPKHNTALFLYAQGYFQKGEYELAKKYWKQLLTLIKPNTEFAKMTKNALQQIDQIIKKKSVGK